MSGASLYIYPPAGLAARAQVSPGPQRGHGRATQGASGQCSSAWAMSPSRDSGITTGAYVSSSEVEYLTLYPRQLIGVQHANKLSSPREMLAVR